MAVMGSRGSIAAVFVPMHHSPLYQAQLYRLMPIRNIPLFQPDSMDINPNLHLSMDKHLWDKLYCTQQSYHCTWSGHILSERNRMSGNTRHVCYKANLLARSHAGKVAPVDRTQYCTNYRNYLLHRNDLRQGPEH